MDSEPVIASAQVDLAADGSNGTKKIKKSHSPPQGDPENPPTIPVTSPAAATAPDPEPEPANCLGEDELSIIFSNSCITTRDLLNFRLVSKRWRDAGASTLLQRNVVYIAHSKKTGSPTCQQQGDGGRAKGVLIVRESLAKLTRLISKSSKFPVSTFQFMFDPYCPRDDYFVPSAELKFFQLHGAKVKGLCVLGSISLEPFLEFLSTYASNIERLNLNQVHFLHLPPIPITITEEKGDQLSQWAPNLIPVKTLEIGQCGDQFNAQAMHLLLSSCPKLGRIRSINRWTLPHILQERKAQLVRSFGYTRPHNESTETEIEAGVALMEQFADVSPELISLKLDLDDYSVGFLNPIASLLESSKDTLQRLRLYILPFHNTNKLKIFPMKNLKYMCLDGPEEMLDEGETFSIWEDGMSAPQIFPSLAKIRLTDFNQENIMEFFQFKVETDDDGSTTVRNSLPTVETMIIQGACLPRNSLSSLMTEFFPNLCELKIECDDLQNFGSPLWLSFPSVEFPELYNIKISRGGLNNQVSTFTDLVFTGFAPELCAKLRNSDLPEFKNEAEGLKFLRDRPSVCDMLHLMELTLVFVELWAEFASRVTGIYAFSQMPNTQFNIFYDPNKFSRERDQYIAEDIDHAELCFASIKPYVQIAQVELRDD